MKDNEHCEHYNLIGNDNGTVTLEVCLDPWEMYHVQGIYMSPRTSRYCRRHVDRLRHLGFRLAVQGNATRRNATRRRILGWLRYNEVNI